jgi:hypothetical protein
MGKKSSATSIAAPRDVTVVVAALPPAGTAAPNRPVPRASAFSTNPQSDLALRSGTITSWTRPA